MKFTPQIVFDACSSCVSSTAAPQVTWPSRASEKPGKPSWRDAWTMNWMVKLAGLARFVLGLSIIGTQIESHVFLTACMSDVCFDFWDWNKCPWGMVQRQKFLPVGSTQLRSPFFGSPLLYIFPWKNCAAMGGVNRLTLPELVWRLDCIRAPKVSSSKIEPMIAKLNLHWIIDKLHFKSAMNGLLIDELLHACI